MEREQFYRYYQQSQQPQQYSPASPSSYLHQQANRQASYPTTPQRQSHAQPTPPSTPTPSTPSRQPQPNRQPQPQSQPQQQQQSQEKMVFVRVTGDSEYDIMYLSEPLLIEDLYRIIQETVGRQDPILKVTLDDITIKNINGIKYIFKKIDPKLEVQFEGVQTSRPHSNSYSVAPVPVQVSKPIPPTSESQWLTLLDTNPFNFGHTGTNVNEHLFIFGGFSDEVTTNNSLLLTEISPTAKFRRLKVRGDLPGPRERHSASIIGKKIYVFGGYSRGPELYYNNLHYFDSETLTWHKIEPNGTLPDRRCGHSGCVIDGKIWIFGGRGRMKVDESFLSNSKIKYFNDLHCYDPVTNEWLRYEPRGIGPSGRALHTATAVGRKMFVFGGANSSGNRKDTSGFCDLYELDIDTMTWTECETQSTPPSPCYGHSATYIGNNQILFYGGKGYKVLNTIHILDLNIMKWTEYGYGGNALSPRWGHSAIFTNNKDIVLYGGRSNDGYYNTVEIIDLGSQLIPLQPEELEREKFKRKQDEKNKVRETIMNLQNAVQEAHQILSSLNNELQSQKREVYQMWDLTKGIRQDHLVNVNCARRICF